PLRDLRVSPGSNDGQPAQLESVRGREVLAAALGAGATTPAQIVIDTGEEEGAAQPDTAVAIGRLAVKLAGDPQVAGIYFQADNAYSIDPSARFVNLVAFARQDFAHPQTLALIERLRVSLIPAAAFPARVSVFVGGAPAAGVDFLTVVERWFPWLVLATLLATYLLLMRAFRSLMLPLKAIILNLLSIASACGLTVAMFSWGWGAPFGLSASDQVEAWIPVMVFAMLFGLSMDYEVFLVSRMREAWDSGASNEEAVIVGLTRTGRLVTSAGLIMFAAFMGFVAGSVVGLQQFGFMLAMSILIDVTVVRALLLPAAMKLFGRWNWYLPRAVAVVLRVTPPAVTARRSVA
ncbi:MAG: MMPL family transporter, partial [Steroidobacterales bacterium]